MLSGLILRRILGMATNPRTAPMPPAPDSRPNIAGPASRRNRATAGNNEIKATPVSANGTILAMTILRGRS